LGVPFSRQDAKSAKVCWSIGDRAAFGLLFGVGLDFDGGDALAQVSGVETGHEIVESAAA